MYEPGRSSKVRNRSVRCAGWNRRPPVATKRTLVGARARTAFITTENLQGPYSLACNNSHYPHQF